MRDLKRKGYSDEDVKTKGRAAYQRAAREGDVEHRVGLCGFERTSARASKLAGTRERTHQRHPHTHRHRTNTHARTFMHAHLIMHDARTHSVINLQSPTCAHGQT